jgi:hypothetical protein
MTMAVTTAVWVTTTTVVVGDDSGVEWAMPMVRQ